jgi:GNAT superfamily N-acetyltransferase
MVGDIRVTEQTRLASKSRDQLRAIYLDSFPPHERAEFTLLVDSIAASERWLFTATRGDDLFGFAIIVPHIASDVHLLEYLAVARQARSAGIGGVLLKHSVDAARANGSIAGILLEVEHDDDGDADERALRARRIAFYERNGARLIEGVPNYRVPLIGRAGMMRMKLLWLAIDANAQPPRGDKLRECAVGILERSYGVSAEDALVLEVMEGIKDNIG